MITKKLRVDLHCHGPEEWILNWPLRKKKWNALDIAGLVAGKLDVMAITENGRIDSRFERLKYNSRDLEQSQKVIIKDNEIYVPQHRVLLMKNQEIATKDADGYNRGHVIIHHGPKIKTKVFSDVLQIAKEQQSAVILAHPFLLSLGACHQNSQDTIHSGFASKLIHALEDSGILRAKGLTNYFLNTNRLNQLTLDFAHQYGYNLVANSDAHCRQEMAKSYSIFTVPLIQDRWEYYPEAIGKILRQKGSSANMKTVFPPENWFTVDRHILNIILLSLLPRRGRKKLRYLRI